MAQLEVLEHHPLSELAYFRQLNFLISLLSCSCVRITPSEHQAAMSVSSVGIQSVRVRAGNEPMCAFVPWLAFSQGASASQTVLGYH